jgi:Secretion system C-terminal sorting domain
VSDGIDPSHPFWGTQYIGKEWDISRATVSSTPATIKLEWNPSDVGVGYNATLAQMLHYNSSITNWEPLPIGNRTASTANSITQTGVTNFSPFTVGLPASVLPVELLSFKGTPQYKTSFLTWETAVEQNLAHFDIESSSDGKTFSKIGNQKAKGQGSTYNFTDEGPLSITTYYRLKMVENDGSFSYSNIISVAFGKDLTVKAFPNPVQNELSIDVISESKQLEIEVIDVLGRSIYQKNESNTEESKLLTINTLDWLSGIYFLKVSDGKKVFQQKIVKR